VRERLRRHILALWERRGVAVDRRRAGVDDAPHTRSAGRQEGVLRADEISCQRGRGVDNLELHGHDGRVVEDHLYTKDYELLCTTSEAMIYICMIRLMLWRLTRK